MICNLYLLVFGGQMSGKNLQSVLAHIDADLKSSTGRLFDFLKIPSISTDPLYKEDCIMAADWLVRDLNQIGFNTSRRDTKGHPMVVGHAGSAGKHLLFYGHYDVQPIDPIEMWNKKPFEPYLAKGDLGDVICARGAADDKGQLMTFIEACRSWKTVHGRLPGKISVFFEGEEESSSPSLIPFMKKNAQELKADIALICDTGLFGDNTPGIVTSLRGLLKEELTITGPSKDLHSGMYGGASTNPARVLSKVLASLHDGKGYIKIPNFYDGVEEVSSKIKSQWEELNFDVKSFLGQVGLSQLAGEHGRTALEMIWARPTCEINGIWSGYTSDGFKTVLPSEASAKVSFRLVGKQNPILIQKNFRSFVRSMLPIDCSVQFRSHGQSTGTEMSIDNPVFEATRLALSDEWSNKAAFIGCGGSIPIAGYFKSILGMDALLIGFGRENDAIHSPNEKYDLRSFHKGIRSWARILDKIYN